MEFSCPTDEGIRTGAGNKHSLRAFSHILFALKIDHVKPVLCHVTANALSEALHQIPVWFLKGGLAYIRWTLSHLLATHPAGFVDGDMFVTD